MTSCHDNLVKGLVEILLILCVINMNGEKIIAEADFLDKMVEVDLIQVHAMKVQISFQVVAKCFPRRVAGCDTTPVGLTGVIGKLKVFLRSICPQVAVHRLVDGMSILVDTGPPVEIPEPIWFGSALINSYFG